MNRQEIFDKVATHLLTQNAKATYGTYNKYDGRGPDGKSQYVETPQCVYRAPDGKKCAAGVLIPDELYDATFEGNRAAAVLGRLADKSPEMSRLAEEISFVGQLQLIHDDCEVEEWPRALKKFADGFWLSDEVLKAFAQAKETAEAI